MPRIEMSHVPEEHTQVTWPNKYEAADIRIVTVIGEDGWPYYYVPNWAIEVFVVFDANETDMRTAVLKTIVGLTEEDRNAAMTVFDLSGRDALILFLASATRSP